jgi:hypothetical protein
MLCRITCYFKKSRAALDAEAISLLPIEHRGMRCDITVPCILGATTGLEPREVDPNRDTPSPNAQSWVRTFAERYDRLLARQFLRMRSHRDKSRSESASECDLIPDGLYRNLEGLDVGKEAMRAEIDPAFDGAIYIAHAQLMKVVLSEYWLEGSRWRLLAPDSAAKRTFSRCHTEVVLGLEAAKDSLRPLEDSQVFVRESLAIIAGALSPLVTLGTFGRVILEPLRGRIRPGILSRSHAGVRFPQTLMSLGGDKRLLKEVALHASASRPVNEAKLRTKTDFGSDTHWNVRDLGWDILRNALSEALSIFDVIDDVKLSPKNRSALGLVASSLRKILGSDSRFKALFAGIPVEDFQRRNGSYHIPRDEFMDLDPTLCATRIMRKCLPELVFALTNSLLRIHDLPEAKDEETRQTAVRFGRSFVAWAGDRLVPIVKA